MPQEARRGASETGEASCTWGELDALVPAADSMVDHATAWSTWHLGWGTALCRVDSQPDWMQPTPKLDLRCSSWEMGLLGANGAQTKP